MNLRILLAVILLNILTLCAVGTAGAEEDVHVKQFDFPELPVQVHFPAKDQLSNLKVSDLEFTPDNQALLLLTLEGLYRLDLRMETLELLTNSPIPGNDYNEPQMRWLNNNRYLIFYNSPLNGAIRKWPSLEIAKENIYNFTFSSDRQSIHYKKEDNGPFYLWNLVTNEEQQIPSISPLQYVDFDPVGKTIVYIHGNKATTDYGYEIKPIELTTWNYATNAVIDSVTLEDSVIREGSSYTMRWSEILIIVESIKVNQEVFLLGVVRSYNNRFYTTYGYTPFIWNSSNGKLVNSILGAVNGVSQYIFFPPPYSFSPDGRWLAVAINDQEMKIIPVEERLNGMEDNDIGPFPRGNFSFSHDSKRVALSYPFDGNFSKERGLAIIDLEPANTVDDFLFHQN